MSEVTRLLDAAAAGDRCAAGDLLPLLYDELRKLAAAKMSAEAPGHSLNPTALVHEAYLRLAGGQQFENRRHFFAAAAEAMRRILIESARRQASLKRGGGLVRRDIADSELVAPESSEDALALDEALTALVAADADAAEVVKLRYFVGLSAQETADALGWSLRSVERTWTYARAWLLRKLQS